MLRPPAIVRICFPPPNITVMVFARESDSTRADVISLVVHQIVFFFPQGTCLQSTQHCHVVRFPHPASPSVTAAAILHRSVLSFGDT